MGMTLWDMLRAPPLAAVLLLSTAMGIWTLCELVLGAVQRFRRRRDGVPPRWSLGAGAYLALCGVLVTVLAQHVGAVVAGPGVRWLFGEPRDFMSDYTSAEALLQGTAVQVGVQAAFFLALGYLMGARGLIRRPTQAYWASNPFTLAFGLFAFFLYHQVVLLNEVPYEYVGVALWALHLLAFGAYARVITWGAGLLAQRSAGRLSPAHQ